MKRMLMINATIGAGLAVAFVIAPGQAAAPSAPAMQSPAARFEQAAASRPAGIEQAKTGARAVRVVYPSPFAR